MRETIYRNGILGDVDGELKIEESEAIFSPFLQGTRSERLTNEVGVSNGISSPYLEDTRE